MERLEDLKDLVDMVNERPQRQQRINHSPRIKSFLDDKGASFRTWYNRACRLGRETRHKAGRPQKVKATICLPEWDPPDPEFTIIDSKWL